MRAQFADETIHTTTPTERLVCHIFEALGQFERDLIRKRTGAKLKAAAAKGRKGGCPIALTPDKVARACQMIASCLNVLEAAASVKVTKSALYMALKDSSALVE